MAAPPETTAGASTGAVTDVVADVVAAPTTIPPAGTEAASGSETATAADRPAEPIPDPKPQPEAAAGRSSVHGRAELDERDGQDIADRPAVSPGGTVPDQPPQQSSYGDDSRAGEIADEISTETRSEIYHDISREKPHASVLALPDLRVNVHSAAALLPKPTVLSIPASIMARFSRVRRDAESHTEVVLDALRATLPELPALVADARPRPRTGDLFPFRGTPVKERREPLRVRPTFGELAVIDRIVEWVADDFEQRLPGSPRVSRSEVVAAALDAHLPGRRSRTVLEG